MRHVNSPRLVARAVETFAATAIAAAGIVVGSHVALAQGRGPLFRTIPPSFQLPSATRTYRLSQIRSDHPAIAIPSGTNFPRWIGSPPGIEGATRITSDNWAGYVAVGTGFTAAEGKWTVPSVAASQSPRNVVTWVGVGGSSTSSLIQTGTGAMTESGSTTYYAWATLITAGVVKFNTPVRYVHPGDQMVALIEELTSFRWRIAIQDVTEGWTVETTTVTSAIRSGESAEWITERPYDSTVKALTTLADFGSTRFDDLRVNTGATETALDASYMHGTTGRLLAYPGPFSTATTGNFTDYYGAPTTPHTTPPSSKRTTTTALSSSKNPSTTGTAVTFTATVTPTTGGGTVTFTRTGTAITGCSGKTLTLMSGAYRATCTTSLQVGTDTIEATYSGDSDYAGSHASLTQMVTSLPPAAPTVSSMSPRTGPTAGGTVVTITGTNLTGASTVVFGTTTAASFYVTGSTRITATSPAHTSGPVNVRVTIPGGRSVAADLFEYLAPRVTSVSTRQGPTSGGTVVTITGTNFVRGATVRFGTKAASRVTVVNSTRITATSPAQTSGSVNVTVTIPGGRSIVSSADLFEYLAT